MCVCVCVCVKRLPSNLFSPDNSAFRRRVEIGVECLTVAAQTCACVGLCTAQEASAALSHRMQADLFKLPIEEAIALTRACGQYLSLTAVAELHHRCAACAVKFLSLSLSHTHF